MVITSYSENKRRASEKLALQVGFGLVTNSKMENFGMYEDCSNWGAYATEKLMIQTLGTGPQNYLLLSNYSK